MTLPYSAIGAVAIGVGAIGSSPSGTIDTSFADAILARSDVVYACEVDAGIKAWRVTSYDAIGAVAIGATPALTRAFTSDAIRIASLPFGTAASDTPANTWFQGRFAGFSFKRSINNNSDFSGVAKGDGEITIDNADGVFDNRFGQVVAGRDITVRIGCLDIAYGSWPILFRGTASDWQFDQKFIHIAIRDDGYRLAVPVQSNLYAGTGGIEGGDDLKGKRKPLLLGYGPNTRPPKLNSDLVYQINDGALDVVFSVRDRGVELNPGADYPDYATLVAATIAGGDYATCLAKGCIRLGSSPIGTVTATAATYRSLGHSTLAAILQGVIRARTVITQFEAGAFDRLRSLYPGDHGIYLDENDNSTVEDAANQLLRGVLGRLHITRDGRCTVGVLAIPDNPVVASYGMADIIGDPTLERLPSDMSPPPWRWRLGYYKNWTEQTDLAGAADSLWGQPGKTATPASDANVLVENPAAKDPPPRDSFMIDGTLADAEVARQFDILKQERPLRRTDLSRKALLRELGDVVELDTDRLGGARLGMWVEDNIDIPETGGEIDRVKALIYG